MNLQDMLEEVREKIHTFEDVEETSSHYENKEDAYARINLSFRYDAKNVRELLEYILKKIPKSVKIDLKARKRNPIKEHYMIELTASGRRDKREKEMRILISRLESEIYNFMQQEHKTRKWTEKLQRSSRKRYSA